MKRNKKKIREQSLVLLLSLFIFLQYQYEEGSKICWKVQYFPNQEYNVNVANFCN